MILVKAPLRLSFFGGGSDIPAHFLEHGGATLSVTFDKYVYVAVMSTPMSHIKLSYSKTEYVTHPDELQHDIVRAALNYFCLSSHVEITSFADIPTVGTGLGASSAFAVCLTRALEAFRLPTSHDVTFDAMTTQEHAQHIELNLVGSPIGYQDHVASAHGGFVYANYSQTGTRIAHLGEFSSSNRWDELADCLFLVKMPERTISANDILKTPMPTSQVNDLAQMAHLATVLAARRDITAFGKLLHDAWEIKRQLHPSITTTDIDAAYQRGLAFGLLGGKLLGAGNGGFLIMCASSPEQALLARTQLYADYLTYPVSFDYEGVRVVYDDRRN